MGNILVTGGGGFIGSHATLALARGGHQLVVLDNFCNAKPATIATIEKMTGQRITTITGDMRDEQLLADIFTNHKLEAVMHFAGLKAVAESVAQPLDYFSVNVGGSIALLRAMKNHHVKKIIFSSSATVYGAPQQLPLTEKSPLAPINPYGLSKLMVEQVLQNLCASDPTWRVATLRYFNPCGADESGLIGEDPLGIPNNLMPILLKVAGGEMEKLQIYGNDYDTPDGTGVRDYIHVVDLVAAHIKALAYLDKTKDSLSVFNLGCGHGHSVLEMVKTFEEATGRNTPLPRLMAPRRPGDSAAVWTDASHANHILQWRASKNLKDMCVDAWRFYQQSKGK
ncbi:MAG: UDP-glucose 4-epimerase GalE [Hydrotalea sp.]|nr:UDP-glucose 4-epimerase GalE [Hydrotalea sp.]